MPWRVWACCNSPAARFDKQVGESQVSRGKTVSAHTYLTVGTTLVVAAAGINHGVGTTTEKMDGRRWTGNTGPPGAGFYAAGVLGTAVFAGMAALAAKTGRPTTQFVGTALAGGVAGITLGAAGAQLLHEPKRPPAPVIEHM